MKKVRVAMIGCGGIAGAHRNGLTALWNAGYRNFEIVATCDVVRDKAQAMADALAALQGTKPVVFEDFRDLLDKGPDCEAVDICTLHSEHHTVAIPCLKAGKHVTIEKPLAITLRAGRKMIRAAEKAGKILHVAENYRLSPHNRAFRWAVQSGMIGKPFMLFWLEVRERLWYWGWREHKMQAGAGWALDGGVHHCDLFRFFMGPVTTVTANVRSFHPVRYKDDKARTGPIEVDVEDCSMAVLEFEGGALGAWVTTNVASGNGFGKNGVYGSEGSLTWDAGLKTRKVEMTTEQVLKAHDAAMSKAEKEKFFPLGVTDGIAIELHQFYEAVQGRGEVETDGWEGYKAEAVALAIFESDRLGRKVTLKEVEGLKVEEYQKEINEELGIK